MKSYSVFLVVDLRFMLMTVLRRSPGRCPGGHSRERVRRRPHRRRVSSSSLLYGPETGLSQKTRCVFLIFFRRSTEFRGLGRAWVAFPRTPPRQAGSSPLGFVVLPPI